MPRIPRHFHFIFGLREQTEPFHLVHYLCLESCLRVNRPDRVTLYYHYEPYGRYWNLIKDRIQLVHVPLHPLVTSQHYDDPLISRKLRYAHHADFIRLEKLIEHGGVYADMDTLFLRPIPDGLYEKAFVIGREDPVTDMKTGAISDSLCNALMMAEPGSAFARIWLERMPAALDGSWSNHSCQLAERLRSEFPGLVHVEPPVSFYPYMWTRPALRALLEENHPPPPGAFSIHLWAHMWWGGGPKPLHHHERVRPHPRLHPHISHHLSPGRADLPATRIRSLRPLHRPDARIHSYLRPPYPEKITRPAAALITMTVRPFLSIVLPCLNEARILPGCINETLVAAGVCQLFIPLGIGLIGSALAVVLIAALVDATSFPAVHPGYLSGFYAFYLLVIGLVWPTLRELLTPPPPVSLT